VSRHKLVLFGIVLMTGSMITVVPASAAGSSGTREISASGVTSIVRTTQGADAGVQFPEIRNEPSDGGSVVVPKNPPTDRSQTRGKAGNGDVSGETGRSGSIKPVLSFDGLNHRAQRLANGGNQFSLEPPDQGLCVGNGFVLETVNDVLTVYKTSGTSLMGVIALNKFYGYDPAIDRNTGLSGPFLTDPSCYFDVATHRWFHVVLTLEVNPDTGDLLGPNHLDLAVSQTSSPLGLWTIYRTPVQDDGTLGGGPNHHCSPGPPNPVQTNPNACIGDYPHIGADANGFYITTNEYDLFGNNFHAAQIYAFSKLALAANPPPATVTVTQLDTTNAVRGNQAGFTVWPAEAANGHFATGNSGTEYFLSSNAADEVNPGPALNRTSTDLIVWALTHTASLNSASPSLSLTNTVLQVARYAAPPLSNQKVGNTPLRQCINDTKMRTPYGRGCWRILFCNPSSCAPEPAHNEVESVIDSNDTRMQQVMYANGTLVGALDTALKVHGKTQAGIEWFSVKPYLSSHGVDADLSGNGYLGARDTNLTYPAIGVNEHGVGVMAFTLLGKNDFPSAAYAPFSAESGPGDIHIAAAGRGPDDGFTSYAAFVGTPIRTRWGDYGAAVVDGSNVWIASEYIGQTCTFKQYTSGVSKTSFGAFGSCGATRTSLGNWDTRITELKIGGH
jgi:hypothetical protein